VHTQHELYEHDSSFLDGKDVDLWIPSSTITPHTELLYSTIVELNEIIKGKKTTEPELKYKIHFYPHSTTNFTQFGVGGKEIFTEEYFDTPNKDLLKSHCWLRYCGNTGAWTMTYEHDTIHNGRRFKQLSNVHEIVGELRDRLRKKDEISEDPFDYCCIPICVFSTTRLYFKSQGDYRVYFDCARVVGNEYYLVGTLEMTNPLDSMALNNIPAIMKELEVTHPVSSKAVHSIFRRNKTLYNELVDKEVIIPSSYSPRIQERDVLADSVERSVPKFSGASGREDLEKECHIREEDLESI